MLWMTTNGILKGTIIALVSFILIESYYAYYYQDPTIYSIILAVVAILILIFTILVNLDEKRDGNRKIYEYIIIIMIFVLVSHPIFINAYFPAHEASVFKSSCIKNVSYSDLNNITKNLEGQKILLEGKMGNSYPIQGTYLLVFYMNSDPNNVAAVLYTKQQNWNPGDTVQVYGVVTAKRPLKEFFTNDGINTTYPTIFAFYIDKKS